MDNHNKVETAIAGLNCWLATLLDTHDLCIRSINGANDILKLSGPIVTFVMSNLPYLGVLQLSQSWQ